MIWYQNDQGIRTSDDAAIPDVNALRGELELYYPKARMWHQDAFLHKAEVNIGSGAWRDLISAHFLSYEQPARRLVITTEIDGNIVRRFTDFQS